MDLDYYVSKFREVLKDGNYDKFNAYYIAYLNTTALSENITLEQIQIMVKACDIVHDEYFKGDFR